MNQRKRYSVMGTLKNGADVSGGTFDSLDEAKARLAEMPQIFIKLSSATLWDLSSQDGDIGATELDSLDVE